MHGGRGCVREPGCSPIASLLFIVRIILGVRVERRRVSPQRCSRLWHRVSMKAKLENCPGTRNGQERSRADGEHHAHSTTATCNYTSARALGACLPLPPFDVFGLHSHLPPGSASQNSTHSARKVRKVLKSIQDGYRRKGQILIMWVNKDGADWIAR